MVDKSSKGQWTNKKKKKVSGALWFAHLHDKWVFHSVGKDDSDWTWIVLFVQSKWLLQLGLVCVNKQQGAREKAVVLWWCTVSQLSLFNLGGGSIFILLDSDEEKRSVSQSGRLDCPKTRRVTEFRHTTFTASCWKPEEDTSCSLS